MAYEVFITILLTAITVVLAALGAILAGIAIGLGAMAFWGFTGVKEELSRVAGKKMAEAMDAKLKEYPSGDAILALIKRLEVSAEFYEQTQSQLVTQPESNTVEPASTIGVKPGEVPIPSGIQPVEGIEVYPGEGGPNDLLDAANASAADGNSAADPEADHRKI